MLPPGQLGAQLPPLLWLAPQALRCWLQLSSAFTWLGSLWLCPSATAMETMEASCVELVLWRQGEEKDEEERPC